MDIFADPNVGYVFLVLGYMLAVMAVLTPGTGIFEVGALIALVLAGLVAYAVPINFWALGVLVLGAFLFALAVRRPHSPRYLASAIGALVGGTAFLFRGQGWRPAVNPVLALTLSALAGGFLWIVATKSLQASLSRPTHDLDKLIGERGETRTEVHTEGSVYVAGELWSARSMDLIPTGTPVRVVRREGFILEVEPIE